MKHLIHWLVGIFGPSTINARCKSIPPNHKIGLFPKGIMILSCVTGQEHKRICSFLLGLIIDLLVPSGLDLSHMVKAACTLLDLLFLAQFQCHTSDTLSWLEGSLAAFHQNKAVFVDLGIWEDFNIPKLYGLVHYALSIHLFGTTDNYNTEQSECLYIDLAKNAYHATNRKDEYSWVVKAPRTLDSMTCTKLNLSGKHQTSRESLVLLEMTQSLLVREEVTLGSFQEHWIGNQVKLRACIKAPRSLDSTTCTKLNL